MIDEKEFSHNSMLYRFRSESEYNFDALLKNEMFASTPNILNDPLDCPITYDLDKLYNKLLKRKAFVQKHVELIFPSSLKKRDPSSFESYEAYYDYYNSICQETFSKLFDGKHASDVKEYIRDLAKKVIYQVKECFGIISFSLTCSNGVMWSHYASNYKGFVLAYGLLNLNKIVNEAVENDTFLNKFKGICGLFKVNYVSTDEIIDGTDLMYELLCKQMAKQNRNRGIMDLILSTKRKDLLINLLTTKEKSWAYEKEIRLIFPREEMRSMLSDIVDYSKPQYFKVSELYYPDGIIIGSGMSDVNKAAVGYYCLNNNRVLLQRINTERLMSERTLYLTLVKPQELF